MTGVSTRNVVRKMHVHDFDKGAGACYKSNGRMSAYRDDVGAVEGRLARLEAAHVERELRRLHSEQRRLKEKLSRPKPWIPSAVRRGAMVWIPTVVMFGPVSSVYPLDIRWLIAAQAITAAVVFATKFGDERRREKEEATLREIDVEIATLTSAPVRVEVPTLESALARVAELEAEEAADAHDEAQAPSRAAR